jgi:UDP-2,4-diacetamido-2,4,6-trideoxy-beta-L-altropyranose hydrolase
LNSQVSPSKTFKIVLRADASVEIGTGHVQRCLTLAKAIQGTKEAQGEKVEVYFICASLPGNLNHWLEEEHGLQVYTIPVSDWELDAMNTLEILKGNDSFLKWPVDWLIVDHYGLDSQWESLIKPYVKHLLVLDDLANRFHDADILIDQNFYPESKTSRYQPWVSEDCLQLVGCQYAILRPEFVGHPPYRSWEKKHYRGLVFFGGTDPTHETLKALKAIEILLEQPEFNDVLSFDVVVGSSNIDKQPIESECKRFKNITFHCQTPHMAKLMRIADFSIGAGGTTTWERCSLGLPTIVITVAENQLELTQSIAEEGAILYGGESQKVPAAEMAYWIDYLIKMPHLRQYMSKKSLQLVDGLGIQRIMDVLQGFESHQNLKHPFKTQQVKTQQALEGASH